MKTTIINAGLCLFLFGLVSFRPWKSINDFFGLRDLRKPVSAQMAAELGSDSVLLNQPPGGTAVQVVLQAEDIDSLHAVLTDQQASNQVVKDSIADAKATGKQLNKTLAQHKKKNQKAQAELMTEQELNQLIIDQNKAAKAGKKKPFDPNEESDLEKHVNSTLARQKSFNNQPPGAGPLPK